MKIAKGMGVRLHVKLETSDGQVIESSDKSGPVDYVHGTGAMLAGLEKELEGLEAGAVKSGVIAAKDAFGTEEMMPTKVMPRAEFPKEMKIDVGMGFEAKGPDGRPVQFKVSKVEDTEVTVRLMHPLAGKDLKYAVKVVGVKDPHLARPPAPPVEALEIAADDIKEDS